MRFTFAAICVPVFLLTSTFALVADNCCAAPLFSSWDDYSKTLASVQGDGRTTESLHATIQFCESVITSRDDTAEIRTCAKMKLATLLIPGFRNQRTIPGVTDLSRGLSLVKEVMAETQNDGDRQFCLGLRARALAQQGKAEEAEGTLSQFGDLASAADHEGYLAAWAMAASDVLEAEGKTDAERIAWYMKQAQESPASKRGRICAAYVAQRAVCQTVPESQMEEMLGLLRKYHPDTEDRKLAEKVWERVLEERKNRDATGVSPVASTPVAPKPTK